MSVKGMKRLEQAAVLEKFGVDPANAMKTRQGNGAIVSERGVARSGRLQLR
jgi:hypothetical protein